MLDFILTDGDITFSVNADGVPDIDMVTGVDRVRQSILIQWRMFLGEWFDDPDAGIPWFSHIFDSVETYSDQGDRPVASVTVEAILRRKTLEVESVDSIISWEMDLNRTTRVLSIDCEVKSSEGVVAVSEYWPL